MDQVQTYRRLKNNTVTLGTIRFAMDHHRDLPLTTRVPPWHPAHSLRGDPRESPPAHFTSLLSRAPKGSASRDHSPNKALSVYRMRNRRERGDDN